VNEADWLASDDPGAMLDALSHRSHPDLPAWRTPSNRKLRLFACGCCRLVWPLLPADGRAAIGIAERHADGRASAAELQVARDLWALQRAPAVEFWRTMSPAAHDAAAAAWWAFAHQSPRDAVRAAALLRDLCGNPWRPVALTRQWVCADGEAYPRCPNGNRFSADHMVSDDCRRCLACGAVYGHPWLTPTVLALARAAYEERQQDGLLDPDRLAVLADALEDAGCQSEELLRHLRGWEWWNVGTSGGIRGPLRGPHARGCWAIDLVLGKE
jgi:hypothetical protein